MAEQTYRQKLNNQQRTLASLKKRVDAMACTWADEDHYLEGLLEALSDNVSEVSAALGEAMSETGHV